MATTTNTEPVTITSNDLDRKPRFVRDMIKAGREVVVTFHSKAWAVVVPSTQRRAELDELNELRAEVQRLQNHLRGCKQEAVAA